MTNIQQPFLLFQTECRFISFREPSSVAVLSASGPLDDLPLKAMIQSTE
jgi:hypothetical protein